MTFHRGRCYTHKNMLDMVIYVTHIVFKGNNYTKLRIRWFNRRGLDINQEEVVKIKVSEYENWYEWKGKAV